jgi:hypothetical protein
MGAVKLFYWGLKQPVCEADHSPPSTAMLENECSYTSSPSTLLLIFKYDNWFIPYSEAKHSIIIKYGHVSKGYSWKNN